MSSIPASAIVSVTPSVLPAGGRALDIIGLLLTDSTRVPLGDVHEFGNATDVADYFGSASTEYGLAAVYFGGFDNSNVKPSKILFAQYPIASVAAWLRSGAVNSYTLTQLKAIPVGTLTLTVNGTPYTAAAVNLAAATSFSNAADIIQTAFGGTGAVPFLTTYDSISGSFVMTSKLSGSGATIDYCVTTALSTSLKLTLATGAVTSQGSAVAAPAAYMTTLVASYQNFATFMTTFDPDLTGNANKLAFANWNGTQNNRYAYVCWDTDISAATIDPAPASLGRLIDNADISGTFLIGGDGTVIVTAAYAAFECGKQAAVDFTEHNGRTTSAFRSLSGLLATCTNESKGDNLMNNGYNFYGAYATANDRFLFTYPGQISGDFMWMDSYIDQIWMNNQLQLVLMVLLTSAKSIPYNPFGYSLIEAAMLDPVLAAVDFGAIRAGVTLSMQQIAEVNGNAGLKIDTILRTRGWYIQVRDATPQVRQARGSPPTTLWYMDGQSIQHIDLASIELA